MLEEVDLKVKSSNNLSKKRDQRRKKNESVGSGYIRHQMIHLCYQKNVKGGTAGGDRATFYIFPDNLSDK